MTTEDFVPINELERLLVELTDERLAFVEFLAFLLDAEVHVLSATEVRNDGTGVHPLLFDRDMGTLVAVFTSRDRAKIYSDRFPYCLTLSGRQLLTEVPANLGVVLNPGSTVGFELPPDGIQGIRRNCINRNAD